MAVWNAEDAPVVIHLVVLRDDATIVHEENVTAAPAGLTRAARFSDEGTYTVRAAGPDGANASRSVDFTRRGGPDAVHVRWSGGALTILEAVT